MASAIIHISVAKKINEKLKMNSKQLYLGAIAPDMAKHLGQTKNTTHFQKSAFDDYPILEDFLDKYKDDLNNPYTLGYYIHLYTDKLWFNNFFNEYVFSSYIHLKDGTDASMEYKEMHELIYQDYTNLNISLIDHYNLDLSLFYEDIENPNTKITEVPVDKLNILIDHMGIIIENSKNEKNYIFDCDDVIKFIDEASEIIFEDIIYLLK
jgi:hypothetical protein